jgi:hypothetical protein
VAYVEDVEAPVREDYLLPVLLQLAENPLQHRPPDDLGFHANSVMRNA